MPFIPDIPKPTDIKSQSQQDLRNNTNAIQTAFEVDHGAFNGAIEGQHVKVTLPNAAAPVFPNPATDVGFYNADGVTDAAIKQAYVHAHKAGPVDVEVPFTESILATSATPAQSSSGWAYLPSGILIKWGSVSVNAGATLAVATNGVGPNFIQYFNIQVTPKASKPLPISASDAGGNQINITNQNVTNVAVYWLVMGHGV